MTGKEPIKLSDDERTILENIDKRYTYIARNEDGVLYVITDTDIRFFTYISVFNHLFEFTAHGDEIYSIEDLLKEGE